MIWYFVYCFPLVVAAITSIFLITIVVPRRRALGAKALISMLIAVAIWEVAYALEIYSPTLDEKIFFAKVEYFGIAAVVPAWLVFTVLYTHQDRWIIRNPIGIVLMSAIPVLSLILVWTNEAHGLIWRTTELDTTTPIPMLAVTHGAGFWLLIVNDYLLVMIGTFWLLATTVQSKGIFRRQAAALLAGILLVWIANILYLGQWVSVSWLDLTPFAMTIAGAIYVWNLLRLHLFEVVPVARTVIYESIQDAIVVTDLHLRIVEINQAAQQFFAPPGRQLVGTLLSPLIGELSPSISAIIEQQAEWRGDTRFVAGGDERVFDLRISTVRGGDQCPLGWLYIFHDITRRWQAEHELEQLALQLEERVQERTHALEAEMAVRQATLVALAESEAHNQAILDTIPDLMVRISCDASDPCNLLVEAVRSNRDVRLQANRLIHTLLPANLGQLTTRASRSQSSHVEQVEYEVSLDGELTVFEARITSISETECLAMIRDITIQRRAELQLRYQANLLDNISDAVISVDNNLRVISWNRAAEALYGYQATEVIGRPLREVTPTSLLDSTPEISISRFEIQGFWNGEVIQRRRDGSAVEIWAAVTTIRDEAGKTLGAVAVNRDMSVIRQMQRALEKSEAKYRAIVESTQDILCSTDATGVFVFVNCSWRNRLGYTEDEARLLHLADVVHPSERDHVMRIFRLVKEGAELLPINTVLCNANGQPLIVEGQVAAAFDAGAFGGIHAYLHDVTDRVFAETAQHEAELRFRNLFEEAPFMYAIVHERNGVPTIVDCNALFVQSLGYDREDLVGKAIRQLMVQPSPACVALFGKTRNRRGLYGEAECALRTSSGQIVETLLRTRNERDEAGHVLGIRAMFVDISERKQLERQLRANSEQLHALSRHIESVREEEQTRIAREIHDELGQMLTALKMDVNWLTHQVDQSNAVLLRKLAAMNDHLGDAIRAVRRIAADLRPPILDQLGLIDALEWLANQVTDRNGVQCTFIHRGDAVVTWDSDLATALFRIAQEALTNVVRHADAVHAWLTLQVTTGEIRLEVRDDGVGIAAERVVDPHAFGLIGIRERLFPWNGRATITGTPHEGTIVTIVIPRHP